MTESGPRHVARYTRDQHSPEGDECLHSPVFERNAPPIIAMLSQYLLGREGKVLEIGAGTGQHAAAFDLAFPTLDWIASDPYPEHRASIRAWGRKLLRREVSPLEIDAATNWTENASVLALGQLRAVYAGNVTHIAPWAVTEGIVRGAGERLTVGGHLFFYGPFRDGREFFGDGNRSFDADLRADNPDWGLRDIGHIDSVARAHGLEPLARHRMPANNHILVFTRF